MTDILKFTFWNALGVFLLEFILICLLIPESFVKTQMREEVMDIADKLGQPTAEEVRTKTTDTFDKLFVRSGVYTTIHRMVIPTEAERMRSVGMEDLGQGIFPYVEERLEAMWYSVTQVIMRVFHFMIWLPFLLLIIVPAILDGIYQRKIRISTFRHVSALRHRAGFQGVVTIIFGLFILAMMPFSIPTLLFPVVGVAIAFMVNMSITFTQKRL
jgi:hypothetical protein